jgi:hypothetical protein
VDGGTPLEIVKVKNTKKFVKKTGANPTIVSYNDGVVKIYNATSSLLRFENKNMLI